MKEVLRASGVKPGPRVNQSEGVHMKKSVGKVASLLEKDGWTPGVKWESPHNPDFKARTYHKGKKSLYMETDLVASNSTIAFRGKQFEGSVVMIKENK